MHALADQRADRPIDPEIAGLYGPASEAWALNREAMLLLGAGPRALLLQLAHPAGRRRRRRPQRLPDRSVGSPRRHAAELSPDRLRDADGGTGGDPPPERAPPDDHRPDLPRPRPGAVAVGPRDAGRLDDRRRRSLARAAVARAARPLLRGDAPDRAGVRDPGRRCCRRISTRSRRTSPARSRPAARSGSGRSPASWPTPSSIRRSARSSRRWPACRPRPTPGRCGRRSGCCRRRSATSTASRWGPLERLVAAWLVAGWRRVAAAPAGGLPADAAGARRRPTGRGGGRDMTRSRAERPAGDHSGCRATTRAVRRRRHRRSDPPRRSTTGHPRSPSGRRRPCHGQRRDRPACRSPPCRSAARVGLDRHHGHGAPSPIAARTATSSLGVRHPRPLPVRRSRPRPVPCRRRRPSGSQRAVAKRWTVSDASFAPVAPPGRLSRVQPAPSADHHTAGWTWPGPPQPPRPTTAPTRTRPPAKLVPSLTTKVPLETVGSGGRPGRAGSGTSRCPGAGSLAVPGRDVARPTRRRRLDVRRS